jgi:glucodextranase-like protein
MKLPQAWRRPMSTGALLAAVTATLAGATLLSRQFFESPTRQLPPRPPTRPAAVGAAGAAALFRVAALEGPVEFLHGEKWYVAQAGDQLTLQDVIRTPRGSNALLRRGGTEIEVRESVDIRLEALANQTATFGVLRGGNVVANVEDDKQSLEITAAGTRAVNRGPARWIVSLAPSGQVSVAAAKGKVGFAAHGKEVTVGAGNESTAAPGRAPGDPEPIPEELLLSVIWPEIDHPEDSIPIAGKVRPSSRVRINGAEARVRPDGAFAVPLPVQIGPNRVDVQAEDIVGRKRTVTKVLRRPAPAPSLESTGEDLWKR